MDFLHETVESADDLSRLGRLSPLFHPQKMEIFFHPQKMEFFFTLEKWKFFFHPRKMEIFFRSVGFVGRALLHTLFSPPPPTYILHVEMHHFFPLINV